MLYQFLFKITNCTVQKTCLHSLSWHWCLSLVKTRNPCICGRFEHIHTGLYEKKKKKKKKSDWAHFIMLQRRNIREDFKNAHHTPFTGMFLSLLCWFVAGEDDPYPKTIYLKISQSSGCPADIKSIHARWLYHSS